MHMMVHIIIMYECIKDLPDICTGYTFCAVCLYISCFANLQHHDRAIHSHKIIIVSHRQVAYPLIWLIYSQQLYFSISINSL